MCGIWDWQSTIDKDLNDSQDPKHTLLCRENAFVAIYAVFFRQQMSPFYLWGGGCPKRTLSAFFYQFFLHGGFPKVLIVIIMTNMLINTDDDLCWYKDMLHDCPLSFGPRLKCCQCHLDIFFPIIMDGNHDDDVEKGELEEEDTYDGDH